MGDLGRQEFMAPVFESYRKEEQRFVRSSYLAAMGNFDYEEYVQDLKECLEELQKTEVTAENQKHMAEEMRELSSLIAVSYTHLDVYKRQNLKSSASPRRKPTGSTVRPSPTGRMPGEG